MPGSEVRSATSKRPRGGGEPRPLSAREREVLGLLAEGMSGAAIADQLVLSPETVRTHVRNAMDKLGASTRSQAVALALELGHIGEQPAKAPTVSVARPISLPSDRGLAGALQELSSEIVRLPDIDSAAVYTTDESGMVLCREGDTAAAGGRTGLPAEVVLGVGGIGRVALERRTQLVTAPGGSGAGAGPVLATPMVGGGRMMGVVCVGVRSSRPISRREMLLLEAFAHRIGEVLASEPAPGQHLQRAMTRFRASWTGTLKPER